MWLEKRPLIFLKVQHNYFFFQFSLEIQAKIIIEKKDHKVRSFSENSATLLSKVLLKQSYRIWQHFWKKWGLPNCLLLKNERTLAWLPWKPYPIFQYQYFVTLQIPWIKQVTFDVKIPFFRSKICMYLFYLYFQNRINGVEVGVCKMHSRQSRYKVGKVGSNLWSLFLHFLHH